MFSEKYTVETDRQTDRQTDKNKHTYREREMDIQVHLHYKFGVHLQNKIKQYTLHCHTDIKISAYSYMPLIRFRPRCYINLLIY